MMKPPKWMATQGPELKEFYGTPIMNCDHCGKDAETTYRSKSRGSNPYDILYIDYACNECGGIIRCFTTSSEVWDRAPLAKA